MLVRDVIRELQKLPEHDRLYVVNEHGRPVEPMFVRPERDESSVIRRDDSVLVVPKTLADWDREADERLRARRGDEAVMARNAL